MKKKIKNNKPEHPRLLKFISKLKNDNHSDELINRAKKIIANESIIDLIINNKMLQLKEVFEMLVLTKINDFIFEGKQVGSIYHYTDVDSVHDILNSNSLRIGFRGNISTTRDKNFHKNSNESKRVGVPTHISLELDGDKLSNNHKITPKNDLPSKSSSKENADDKISGRNEREEVINKDVDNVKKYIKKIRIHKPLRDDHVQKLKIHGIEIEHDYK